MKTAGIILIILCLIAVCGAGYLYFNSNMTVSFVECIATDPSAQLDYYLEMKDRIEKNTFVGTLFTDTVPEGPEKYVFYTWTVKLDNQTSLSAKIAEIQIVPMSGDVLQIGAEGERNIPARESATLSATVLTSRQMHNVREAIVTWYFWGLPFSSRITLSP